jgi:hypothetical protein
LADLAWKAEGALADIGLAPGEVRAVVVFAGHKGINSSVCSVEIVGEGDLVRHIARRGQRLTAASVEKVLAAAMSYFPLVGAPAPVAVTLPEPIMYPEPAPGLDHLTTESDVEAAILEGLLAPPIEERMTFLHPDQAKLVRRSFNGPSRIRGAAGTGKTVVGLHRAAYLARSQADARVLVASFCSPAGPHFPVPLTVRAESPLSGQIRTSGSWRGRHLQTPSAAPLQWS